MADVIRSCLCLSRCTQGKHSYVAHGVCVVVYYTVPMARLSPAVHGHSLNQLPVIKSTHVDKPNVSSVCTILPVHPVYTDSINPRHCVNEPIILELI